MMTKACIAAAMLMVMATSVPGPGAASAPAPTSAAQDEAMVFLLAGQSNMVGRGRGTDLPAEHKTQPKNVLFYLDGALRELAPAGGSEESVPDAATAGLAAAPNTAPSHTIISIHSVGLLKSVCLLILPGPSGRRRPSCLFIPGPSRGAWPSWVRS
jgi:hypothetical protein